MEKFSIPMTFDPQILLIFLFNFFLMKKSEKKKEMHSGHLTDRMKEISSVDGHQIINSTDQDRADNDEKCEHTKNLLSHAVRAQSMEKNEKFEPHHASDSKKYQFAVFRNQPSTGITQTLQKISSIINLKLLKHSSTRFSQLSRAAMTVKLTV